MYINLGKTTSMFQPEELFLLYIYILKTNHQFIQKAVKIKDFDFTIHS